MVYDGNQADRSVAAILPIVNYGRFCHESGAIEFAKVQRVVNYQWTSQEPCRVNRGVPDILWDLGVKP